MLDMPLILGLYSGKKIVNNCVNSAIGTVSRDKAIVTPCFFSLVLTYNL